MIIDSHVHISLYENNAKSLEESRDLLLKEMKKNNVEYAIIIPDNVENDTHIAGLEKAIELTKNLNNFFLLGSPQIIQERVGEVEKYESLLKNGVVKGIKFFPGHDPYYPTDKRCFPYYSICEDLNLPVVFHTGENSNDCKVSEYNDPKYIVKVAKKYPKLKVIITHYFWPKIDYCYEITKDVSNIYFELAGTANLEVLEKSGGIEKMKKVLEKTVKDRPNQVIFGTDWPMCNIKRQIGLVKSLRIDKKEQEKIFSKNAIEVYKLQI